MPPSPPTSLSNLKEFFSRGEKEKIPPDLKTSLTLLHLQDLGALEERFLATDAFLKPWAVFRDSIFLLQPDAMQRATSVAAPETTNGISPRLDLLWFYTQFDEDERRYDPSRDQDIGGYARNSRLCGIIDKSKWGVDNYEKHLYVWLLQEFKVGKASNCWGFDYFELRNVCTAWQTVFVPIINAVRASYSSKGRRYYGRLALFIEDCCPSRLAFPEGNVGVPDGGIVSPTPFRIVSVPKRTTANTGSTSPRRADSIGGMLGKKHYDETEKELRDVYPQYGGLVERPKFKHKMEEWLAEQRARADRRKIAERHGEVQTFQLQVVKRDGSQSPIKKASPFKRSQIDVPESPIKRYSNSIRRSLSWGMSSRPPSMKLKMPKEEPKSPLHGVTRQIYIPDDEPLPRRQPPTHQTSSFYSIASDDTEMTPMPRAHTQRMPSEQSVYTSIRNSNPFVEDVVKERKAQYTPAKNDVSVFSPMGHPSAIPRPLYNEKGHDRSVAPTPDESPSVRAKKLYADVRIPSYEGTGYQAEISLSNLHADRSMSVRTPEPVRLSKMPTRLPAPIQPVLYGGHLRATSNETERKPSAKPIARPSQSQSKTMHGRNDPPPPKSTAWPGAESDDDVAPPVPPKSPERKISNLGRGAGARPQQLMREDAQGIPRIVSKENIRAALGNASRESSVEELNMLPPPMPKVPYAEGPRRTMSPGGWGLQTYNTHLFPRREERKGTPVGAWVGETRRRLLEEYYEMEALEGGKREVNGETAEPVIRNQHHRKRGDVID